MKKIVTLTCLLLALIAVCITVYAQEQWSDLKLQEEYEFGTILNVPEVTLTFKGDSAKASAVVQFPNGSTTTESQVTLDIAGQYTIIYTAVISDEYFVKEDHFYVYKDLASVNSDNSSISYGKYSWNENVEGLMVRLAEGDTLTLNQPIDVESLEKSDLLIQAMATPSAEGQVEFNKLCFQLTDVNNPEITLYFAACGYPYQRQKYTYVVAGGNGQTARGYELASGKVHNEGMWGCPDRHSFFVAQDNFPINLYIDNETKEVFHGKYFIIDLDNPKYYSTMWNGFPSGKAYLTIWADEYYGETANFCLMAAGDVDLTADKAVDSEPPVITIDNRYEQMPDAVKGGVYQYVPSASALDVFSGECEVTTSVWYNYNSNNPILVNCEEGKFETHRLGYYAIVYESVDEAGNLAKEILWVKAVNDITLPDISLKDTAISNYIVGECFKPQEYAVTCHTGEADVTAYLKSGAEIVPLNASHRFETVGKNTVIYRATDCAGQIAELQFDINVIMGDTPILVDEIHWDRYMVEDVEYTFPTVYFNDYRSGKVERKIASGKITDASGVKVLQPGDTYSVKVNSNLDTITIAFECEGANYCLEVPVVKAWQEEDGRSKLQIQNYFDGSGYSVAKEADYLTFNATEPNGGWTFAIPQLLEGFQLSLQGVASQNDFESIEVTLQDYTNPKQKLSFELLSNADYLIVRCGEQKTLLGMGTDFAAEGLLNINYKDGCLSICGTQINIDNFQGFDSQKGYLSVNFVNAGANAAYRMTLLNGHAVNSANADRTGPMITIFGEYGGMTAYGSEVLLPKAYAGDTLCPNVTFTMSVISNGQAVSDVNGVLLENVDPTREYVIKADKYGSYEVVYTAQEEFSSKPASRSYVILVVDDEPPALSFHSKYVEEAHVGDILCVPDYDVKDNITVMENIAVIKAVVVPNGTMLYLPASSNSVVASEEGEYEFIVMALDENGNLCSESWTVAVKGS